MAEVLSQNEIDALLGAISSGDVGGGTAEAGATDALPAMQSKSALKHEKNKKIKLYDFKRPDKFSKDQIRTLQMMHETFARGATTSLSARLRTLTHVHVASVDQLTYEEFIKSIPNPTTLSVIDMSPLKGKAILEIDPGITFAIIDRLFGGGGWAYKNSNRELTEIESAVIEKVIIRLLNELREAWMGVVELRPAHDTMESNPQFVQIVPPNDMVVLITLETKVGDIEGITNLCIPYTTIEPIASKLSAQFWYSSIRKGSTTENLTALKSRMDEISIPLIALLGETTITVRELLSLKSGDVLRLGQKFSDDLMLAVGTRGKFSCRAGTLGNKMCVQITSLLNEKLSDDLIKTIDKGGANV